MAAVAMNGADYEHTRRRLAEGSLMGALRADPPPGVRLRNDAELETTRQQALRQLDPGADLHVFGYGSLMWNPALDVVTSHRARVHGWHRRFCLRMLFGRGSVQQPGAMLALDRGGACHGVLFRIAAAKVQAESHLLWRREMLAGSYDARWVRAEVDGVPVRALTFVVNRRHERYIGGLPIDEIARLICTGQGSLGTARMYFDWMVEALGRLGIRDVGIERLRRVISREQRRAG